MGDLHNYRRINIELHCHQWLLIVLCSSAIIIFNLSPQCFVPFNISHLLIRSIFHIKQISSSNFFFSLFTFNTYPSFPLLLFLLYSFSGSKWSLLVLLVCHIHGLDCRWRCSVQIIKALCHLFYHTSQGTGGHHLPYAF